MKKKILLTAFISLIGIIFLFMCGTFSFTKLYDRNGTRVQIPKEIQQKVMYETRGKNAIEIAQYCSRLTCDLLEFSFDQDKLWQNDISKAHCVTYSRVCSALCNLAFQSNNVDASTKVVVGHLHYWGVNLHPIALKILPAKYHRYLKDHDVVELNYNNKTIYLDPTLHDLMDSTMMM
jgi:hypothetical protein